MTGTATRGEGREELLESRFQKKWSSGIAQRARFIAAERRPDRPAESARILLLVPGTTLRSEQTAPRQPETGNSFPLAGPCFGIVSWAESALLVAYIRRK